MSKARDIADRKLDGTDLELGDNDKAVFGDGSDLQIYHNGSASVISDVGTGRLYIGGNDDVFISNADLSEIKAKFTSNGAVQLAYDNVWKLATTSTGVGVTGTVTADGLTLDTSEDIIQWTSGNGIIEAPNDLYIRSTGAGTVRLQDNVDVTGTVTADGLTVDGNGVLNIQYDSDKQFYFESPTGASLDISKKYGGVKRKVADIDRATGDISFYEDTGTTAKFFWDASAESLGIGTSSPANELEVVGDIRVTAPSTGTTAKIGFENASGATPAWIGIDGDQSNSLSFHVGSNLISGSDLEAFRIKSDGDLQYASGNYAYIHRAELSGVTSTPQTAFDLYSGNGGRGYYLVTACRYGASVAARTVALVANSSSSLSIIYDVLSGNSQLTLGVSGSSVTVSSTSSLSVHVTAIPIGLTKDFG